MPNDLRDLGGVRWVTLPAPGAWTSRRPGSRVADERATWSGGGAARDRAANVVDKKLIASRVHRVRKS